MRKIQPYTTKDGRTTYRVRYRHPPGRNGKQTSETFDHQTEAQRFAGLLDAGLTGDEALRQMDLERAAGKRLTLDELAEQFFTWKSTRVRSDRTVADYRRDYNNWIKPTLGHRAAESVTEYDVQQLIDGMHGRLEAKSIVDRHAILFGIYKYGAAASRRLVPDNPCIGTELPKRIKKPPKGLRPAEWQALYPALCAIDQDGADLALFMLATGWRVSEAGAVDAFDCVATPNGHVVVNMTRVIRRNAAGQHLLVEDGKSAAAQRILTLDRDASAMVMRRLEAIGHKGLVFTTKQGSQWHSSNFNNRIWKPAVKAAGLTRNPTPHWLRHTAVFWFLDSKMVSLPEIQRRIGHEHISTTIDVYGRMIEDVSTDALDAFAAMRGQTSGPAPTLAEPARVPPQIEA